MESTHWDPSHCCLTTYINRAGLDLGTSHKICNSNTRGNAWQSRFHRSYTKRGGQHSNNPMTPAPLIDLHTEPHTASANSTVTVATNPVRTQSEPESVHHEQGLIDLHTELHAAQSDQLQTQGDSEPACHMQSPLEIEYGVSDPTPVLSSSSAPLTGRPSLATTSPAETVMELIPKTVNSASKTQFGDPEFSFQTVNQTEQAIPKDHSFLEMTSLQTRNS